MTARSSDDYNRILRRLWAVIVEEGLADGEAFEVIARLQISIAMARAGGDPKKAVFVLQAEHAATEKAMLDPSTKVQRIITAKGGEASEVEVEVEETEAGQEAGAVLGQQRSGVRRAIPAPPRRKRRTH